MVPTKSAFNFVVGLFVVGLTAGSARALNSVNINQPYDVDADTLALFHFDGNFADGAGSSHTHARYTSSLGPGYTPGLFDQALTLYGNHDYVSIGNVHQNPTVSTAQGTIEMWVDLFATPDYLGLSSAGGAYGTGHDDGFFLGRHPAYSNDLVFMIWNDSIGWIFADSGLTPESLAGSWHELAGTWGPEGIEIWVDGVLRGTNPYTGGLPNPNYQRVLIGTDSWGWDTTGKFDEVRLSDVQRDPVNGPFAIPEPLTGGLAALGLAALALATLRRRRA